MSSPHLDTFSTIAEARDDLWPLTQENNSSQLVLEPSMFDNQVGHIGKELLENGNVHEKPDKDDDAYSTSIELVDQCSFPIGNGNGNELDSILFLERETSALPDHNEVSQEERLRYCPSGNSGLLCPLYDSDYPYSLLQVRTSMPIENSARTNELVSSSFILEPVLEPNIDVGSSLESCRVNYPIDNSLSADLEVSDELDLLLQESSTPPPSSNEKTKDDQTDLSLDIVPEQKGSAEVPCNGEGITAKQVSAETRGRNYYGLKGLQAGNKEIQADEGEGSTVKKQEHNAKERVRRMKLHACYLALGALLPDSSRSKKKKSAPRIIDRAVEYIPELEEEIEKLTLRKNDMLSKIKNKQPLNQNPHFQLEDLSVSVHEIKQGEFIIQICRQRHPDDAFSNLLQKVEEEEEEGGGGGGMCILSASTLQVSDDGVCYHLHIQINGSLNGANHLTSLREKIYIHILDILIDLEEFLRNSVTVEKPAAREKVCWKAPINGMIKINFDGAFVKTSFIGGIGCVARDWEGVVLGVFAGKVDNAADPETTEALAAWRASEWAFDMRFNVMQLEGDALSVISKLKRKEDDLSLIGPYIDAANPDAYKI